MGLAAWCLTHTILAAESPISLDGSWRFELDRNSVGLRDRWFERTLEQSVHLPGTLPQQGIGDDVSLDTKWMGDVKQPNWYNDPNFSPYQPAHGIRFPFWLQPTKYYAGAAWYQRDVEIPAAWQGKRVVLLLERPHWETRVWLDGRPVGTNDSLSTAHEYDLGANLAPGKHCFTIRVDNGLVVDLGVNSHSISDHTQGNWNGIVGRVELSATDPVWIDDVQVFPDAHAKMARVHVEIANDTNTTHNGNLILRADSAANVRGAPPVSKAINVPPGRSTFDVELPLGENASLWDEFSPNLHRLRAELEIGGGARPKFRHHRETSFGLREIATEGTQFLINGRKTFFRGTLECAIFPATGHPPLDVESWRRIIRICREHGLNMIRFHSWCPPEAAFVAADEAGFYFQVEAASWANQSTTLGDGKPVDDWVLRETDRILRVYGNHPSFVLMAYGNEPGGKNYEAYLADWVRGNRARDPRRLYTGGSAWPQLDENQFHVTPDPRIHAWTEGTLRINSSAPATQADYRQYICRRKVPVISHEIGQWCVYPNFDEMSKYTGYLQPKNFELFRASLAAHHMGDQARDFLMASGKLQTLCYKEEIESTLRTPGMGGFQLLDLHDFPGQGTALVGVLDPFWDSKDYVTPTEFRKFCNSTVVLARLAKRVFTTDERLEADLEVAHFGPALLENAVLQWKVCDEHGDTLAGGELPPQTIPVDNGISLGHIEVDLHATSAPSKLRLVAGIAGTEFENDWDLWVYPVRVDTTPPPDVTIVDDLDEAALDRLASGGKVLLLVPANHVRGDRRGPVGLGFSSIFWNTAWTGRQPPHTLGILCDPAHPLFACFPTESHSNWQWWYLINRAGAMILDSLPAELQPTVQVIDDWVTNRRLGLLFEVLVGPGKLIVCSIDLRGDLESDPVLCQFRHSLLQYMASDRFAPRVSISTDLLQTVVRPRSAVERLGIASATADSAEAAHEAMRAIDGDPATIWHTPWRTGPPGFPHFLQLEFQQPLEIRGVRLLPRQDGVRNGWINGYELYLSEDGQNWNEPAAVGNFDENGTWKAIEFDRALTGRFIRLVATSGFDSLPYASLAEIEVLTDDAGEPIPVPAEQ